MFSFVTQIKPRVFKGFSRFYLIRLAYSILLCTGLTNFAAFASEANAVESEIQSLFGIAVHQELRNDIYVGAMFVPDGIDAVSQIYDEQLSKKMSFRFIQAYSNRKIGRLWKQRIAMNNEKSDWQGQTKNIVAFTKLFKRSLQSGDEINLVFIPNSGTKIYLNQTLFLTIKDPQFYRLLLNIWYGNVPPSSLFKTGISGNNTDYLQKKLISQYESLVAIPGRFDSDKPKKSSRSNRKTSAIKTERKPAKKKPSSPPAAQPAKRETLAKQLVDSFKPDLPPTSTNKDTITQLGDRDDLFKVELTPESTVINTRSIKPIDLSQETSADTSLEPTESESTEELKTIVLDTSEAQSEPIKQEIVKTVTDTQPTENDELDRDLIRGTYIRELINLVKSNQTYPKKALKLGHEGSLRLSITIDREGNIMEVDTLKRSSSRYLDRGVTKQVKNLSPLIKIPDELDLETLTFEIPFSFSFAK